MIYENIVKICEQKKISISQLEREAGLSNGLISKWKTCNPKIENLQAVAKVLKVKVDKLIQG